MDNEARILLDDAIACCQRDGLDARLVNMLASARACDLTDDALNGGKVNDNVGIKLA